MASAGGYDEAQRGERMRQPGGWPGPWPWMAALMATSCGYSELPRLMGDDAPVDGSPQVTSCMGLAPTCGPGANQSCCLAAPVTGGTFYRSDDSGAPATVSPFVLDTYEVTVGRFRAFVTAGQGTRSSAPAAGAGAHPRLAGSGWDGAWNASLVADTAALVAAVKCSATYQTWTDTPGVNESKAMSCVSWYEAMAFCIWDGGYLPTEAEWNYAASGGSEQRVYPWSNPSNSMTIDCMYANYRVDNPVGTFCVNGTTGAVNTVGSKSSTGDGQWGQSDLGGNVWEWTLDYYASTYPSPCNDCANSAVSAAHVVRGGGFSNVASYLRAAYRSSNTPSDRYDELGLRCARTP